MSDILRMFVYKSTKFDIVSSLTDTDGDPSNYSDDTNDSNDPSDANSYRKKMNLVLSQSPLKPKKGGWFAAKCNSVPSGDDRGQSGNDYLVYFALKANDQAVTGQNVLAAAPCPPFCSDEGAFDGSGEEQE